jgi:hypothetical protein
VEYFFSFHWRTFPEPLHNGPRSDQMRLDFVSFARMSRFILLEQIQTFFGYRGVASQLLFRTRFYLTLNLELDSDSIHPSELWL